MGIVLDDVAQIVLSHSHYDHTGGLATLRPTCPVYAGEGVDVPSFSKQPGDPVHPLGMPDSSRAVFSDADRRIVSGLVRIGGGVWLRAPIPRVDPMEHIRGFYYDEMCTRPSRVPEELALLTADGVLVTGCCHSGIINTVEAFCGIPDLPRIRAMVGGLHLCWSCADDIRRATDYLNSLRLEKLLMLHCTGDEAADYLAAHLDCEAIRGASGDVWKFD